MQNRILTLHERQLASLVDDISRIEATSYQGWGLEKVYLHEGADVTRAISQLASSALVVLKYMPRNITPPLVLRYSATDVPIIQLSLSSTHAPGHQAQRSGPEHHPAQPRGRARCRGSLSVRRQAARHHGGSRSARIAVARAVGFRREPGAGAPERDPAVRRREDRQQGLRAVDEQQPESARRRSTDFPIKVVDGRTVFMRDVANVHDGFQVQTNSVAVDGTPGALMSIRKTGGVSTLAVIDGVKKALPDIERLLPSGVTDQADLRPVDFRQGGAQQRADGWLDGGRPDRADDPAVSGQLAADAHHPRGHSAVDRHCGAGDVRGRPDAQHDDAGRLRAGGRHPGGQRHRRDREHRTAPAAWTSRWRRPSCAEPARSACRPSCRPCASASCSSRSSCCRARRSTCSRRCRSRSASRSIASLALSFTLVPVLFKYLMRPSADRFGHGRGAYRGWPENGRRRSSRSIAASSAVSIVSRNLSQHACVGRVATAADDRVLCAV